MTRPDEAVRVLDVSYRGRSWQFHDLGRATWLVYPWYSTRQVWGQINAIEWAERAGRWEAINRSGTVTRFGSFADAAAYACGFPRTIDRTSSQRLGPSPGRTAGGPVRADPGRTIGR